MPGSVRSLNVSHLTKRRVGDTCRTIHHNYEKLRKSNEKNIYAGFSLLLRDLCAIDYNEIYIIFIINLNNNGRDDVENMLTEVTTDVFEFVRGVVQQ